MMSETGDRTLHDQLQRRVARLLLRHDRRTFRGHFRELFRQSELPKPSVWQAYDAYTRLLALADELLDEIVPRIRRQMSFQATRETRVEEPPLRGQIDWPSSLATAWNEQPDQPPTRFTTTLRNRTFATPENRLVVAVLSAYAHALKQMRTRTHMPDVPLTDSEKRTLLHLEDRVRRVLATPHFRPLAHEAQTVPIPQLIATVKQHLRPGKNAYRDLLNWWQRFEQLHISRTAGHKPAAVLQNDMQLSLLYQLWIALELVEFLAEQHVLHTPTIRTDHLSFSYSWQGREFRLVYDRQPAEHLAWDNAPGERPDYFIHRAEPLVVAYQGKIIWREPGVLLDAKCFTSGTPAQTTSAIKRMLADLQLVDASQGMLLLPVLHNITADKRHLHPKSDRYLSNVAPNMEVRLHTLRPMEQQEVLHGRMREILDQVAAWLPEREPIACHGFLQDADTRNPGGTQPYCHPQTNEVLAICRKPHISPLHADLVSPRHDCLQNPKQCHIMGQIDPNTVLPPFIQRVQSQEDLLQTIAQLRELLQDKFTAQDESAEADEARSRLLNAIGELTEAYFKFKQPPTLDIEEKLKAYFADEYWQQSRETPRGLPKAVRHMLISGEYVRSELKGVGIQDWAACAVQYVRALEVELKRRLYETSGDPSKLLVKDYKKQEYVPMKSNRFTFGTVTTAYQKRPNHKHWQVFLSEAVVKSGADAAEFEELIGFVDDIRQHRNNIAHGARISENIAEGVRERVLRKTGTNDKGVLPRLVMMLDAPGQTS
jgi:hypothetical protein